MKRYEYLKITCPLSEMGIYLNDHGQKGWELVAILDTAVASYSLIFKRPLDKRREK